MPETVNSVVILQKYHAATEQPEASDPCRPNEIKETYSVKA